MHATSPKNAPSSQVFVFNGLEIPYPADVEVTMMHFNPISPVPTRGSSLAPAKQCWSSSAESTPQTSRISWIEWCIDSPPARPSRSVDNLFTGMAPTGEWGRVLLWPPRERWHAIKSLDVGLCWMMKEWHQKSSIFAVRANVNQECRS